jgi:oligopeptide transport system ATP-binding protein
MAEAVATTNTNAPMANGSDPLLKVNNLVMHFPLTQGIIFQRKVGAVQAVDGISFEVKKGETLGLVGESGCGKSTTGRAILQLYKPTSGEIVFQGKDLTKLPGGDMRKMRRHLQMIFQDPYASLNPRMTVGSIIAEPMQIHGLVSKGDRNKRVQELLQTVGLNPYFADRYPHEFSGGQRQRIGIARALAANPAFIVADEPVSALDVSIQAQTASVHQSIALRRADSGPSGGERPRAHHSDRRCAKSDQSAVGMPLPHAVPVRDGRMQEHRSDLRRSGRWPLCCVSPLPWIRQVARFPSH